MRETQLQIQIEAPVGTSGGVVVFNPAIKGEEVNLTELWRHFGSIKNKEPRQWRRKEGREFIETFAQKLNVPVGHVIRSVSGKGGGTWAHWQVATSYMTYLSPEAQMKVNEPLVASHINILE